MKKNFFLLGFLSFFLNIVINAQSEKKYIIIDTDSSYFKMYSLKTKDSIFVGTEITLINVIGDECRRRKQECETGIYYNKIDFEGDYLTVISILPDSLGQKLIWQKISKKSFSNLKCMTYNDLVKLNYDEVQNYKKRSIGESNTSPFNQFTHIIPVIKRNGDFYICKNTVVTNFYKIIGNPTYYPIQTDAVTLNYNAKPFKKDSILMLCKQYLNVGNYANNTWLQHIDLAGRVYLTEFNRELRLFKFWYLPPIVRDSGCLDGLSEFIYSLDNGIVGASFECYIKELLAKNNIFHVKEIPVFKAEGF